MSVLHAIFASTSGHTEYVIDTLIGALKEKMPTLQVKKQRAESAMPEDLLKGDVLLLASSTWNTGTIEGQLNPHMHAFLKERAKDVDLAGRKALLIALGDDRYRYKANAAVHIEEFVKTHNGHLLSTFKLLNEPYGQEGKILSWVEEIVSRAKDMGLGT